MSHGDQRFIDEALDAATRPALVSRLRFSRLCSHLACVALLLAAFVCLAAGQPALCGLFAGLGAVNLTMAVSADARVKLALLAERLAPGCGKATAVLPSPGSPATDGKT